MSHLPVPSRIKAPTSRIAKPPTAKAEGVPRSGLKAPSVETPQKSQSGLRQPVTKKSNINEVDDTEKKSSLVTGSNTTTPRTKLTKTHGLQQTPVTKREGISGIAKRASAGSSSSLNREPEIPSLSRERTQESIKDAETGILFKIGDRVLVAGTKAGVIEYLGETQFAKGFWAGIKLDEPTGKNNGCVAGVKYFDCEPLHGVFSKVSRLHKINIVPEKKTSISDFKLEDSNVLKIGDSVIVSGTKLGTLRYLGPTEFAKGEWAGVELEEPLGKNDGAVAGTRYFTCEPKYGLFAPATKVTKSKKRALPHKHQQVFSPEASLANVAKSVFKKPTSADAPGLPTSPTREKQSIADVNRSTSPNESQASPKKTPSAPTQVAALQSALEEREREIRKMLMERELEKAEKLKGLRETDKEGDSSQNEKAIKEKDELIQSLRDELEKLKSENSNIQTKLDEEKKKFEDLQFMLEEEKITDDELKSHVREDEGKIKELSEQTNEKTKKILDLQRELQEAHANNISNEAKILELSDELSESKTKITEIKNSMSLSSGTTEEMEGRLTIANIELNESKEAIKKKTERINELERKLSAQLVQQNNEVEKTLSELIATTEAEKRATVEQCEKMKTAKEKAELEGSKLWKEKNDIVNKQKLTAEKLQSLEKKYKDLSETSILAAKKDEAAKATSLGLNATILDLEDQLSQSKIKILDLESNISQATATSEQKHKQLETSLVNANKEIDQQKELVNEKTKLVNEMENKLKEQILRQKEIEKDVEHLDQADKKVTLMKEAHRSEVESLQSKINSLSESIVNLEQKQQDLISNHRKEIEELQLSEREEIGKMNEKILLIQTEKNDALKECASLKLEKNKILEELSRLQTDHNDLKESKKANCAEVEDLQNKYNELSEANQILSSERNDAIQLCEDQDQQLDLLKKEKDGAFLERDSLSKERDELWRSISSLQTEIKTLHCESSLKQGELQQAKEAEIQNLKAKLDKMMKDKETTSDSVGSLQIQQKNLEKDIQAKVNEINKLKSEQETLLSQSLALEDQVNELKRRMMEENESARRRVVGLETEISNLKDDVEEAQHLVKNKENDIETYKEQIERMKGESIPKSPMDGDILENASTLLIRLHEAESKLSVLQTEKETTEEQVDFLNSVIVDLQNKNEKANQTIALLEAGDEAVILHGLDSESDDELLHKPKFTMRKFCDICDVFDQHDTDECPLQAGSADDTGGVQHHGNRSEDRPYCGICESFGHWSEECDDEQTF